MKIAQFHPYFYKGIVLKIRGDNRSLRYFCLELTLEKNGNHISANFPKVYLSSGIEVG